MLFVDTEGFESTGRSNTYDDRVFAVATVLSSLLIYNLPETIRGSDVSKLSFVVELAQGFYDQGNKVGQGEACISRPGAQVIACRLPHHSIPSKHLTPQSRCVATS